MTTSRFEITFACLILLFVIGVVTLIMWSTKPECRVGTPVWVSTSWICDANRK